MTDNITTLLTNQAPDVQKLDSAIHQINHSPTDKCQGKQYAICWMEIYPVDSAIHLLNKSGQVNNQSITINWRDAIHFDSEDDNRTGLETSVTVNRSTLSQTIIFYPRMKLPV